MIPRGLRAWGGRLRLPLTWTALRMPLAVGYLGGRSEYEAGICFRLVLNRDDQAHDQLSGRPRGQHTPRAGSTGGAATPTNATPTNRFLFLR